MSPSSSSYNHHSQHHHHANNVPRKMSMDPSGNVKRESLVQTQMASPRSRSTQMELTSSTPNILKTPVSMQNPSVGKEKRDNQYLFEQTSSFQTVQDSLNSKRPQAHSEKRPEQMNVYELKDKLREMQLPIYGCKRVLCQRLLMGQSPRSRAVGINISSSYLSAVNSPAMSVSSVIGKSSPASVLEDSASSSYASYKLNELREKCKGVGLPSSGRKQEVIDRLDDYYESSCLSTLLLPHPGSASGSDGNTTAPDYMRWEREDAASKNGNICSSSPFQSPKHHLHSLGRSPHFNQNQNMDHSLEFSKFTLKSNPEEDAYYESSTLTNNQLRGSSDGEDLGTINRTESSSSVGGAIITPLNIESLKNPQILEKLTLLQLRQISKILRLRVAGKKAELIQRIFELLTSERLSVTSFTSNEIYSVNSAPTNRNADAGNSMDVEANSIDPRMTSVSAPNDTEQYAEYLAENKKRLKKHPLSTPCGLSSTKVGFSHSEGTEAHQGGMQVRTYSTSQHPVLELQNDISDYECTPPFFSAAHTVLSLNDGGRSFGSHSNEMEGSVEYNDDGDSGQKRQIFTRTGAIISERIDEVLSQRFFLLSHIMKESSWECSVLDDANSMNTAAVVKICTNPCCTCEGFRARGIICAHILFVFLRILRMSSDDYIISQPSLTAAELQVMMQKLACLEAQSSTGGLALTTTRRLQVSAPNPCGDIVRENWANQTCGVCFEPMNTSESLVWCRAECGKNLHAECLNHWLRLRKKEDKTCPYCFVEWKFVPPSMNTRYQMRSKRTRDGPAHVGVSESQDTKYSENSGHQLNNQHLHFG